MASSKKLSKIALRPRAPVFLAMAFFAIILIAPSVKCNLTWKKKSLEDYKLLQTSKSIITIRFHKLTLFRLNIFLYCLESEFFGSVRTWMQIKLLQLASAG
jgi:hypothetical protein